MSFLKNYRYCFVSELFALKCWTFTLLAYKRTTGHIVVYTQEIFFSLELQTLTEYLACIVMAVSSNQFVGHCPRTRVSFFPQFSKIKSFECPLSQ